MTQVTSPARAWPARQTWTQRVWAEYHADNLTALMRDVLLTLLTYRGHGGLIYPSHATLAARVNCSVRTVQRALQQGDLLGLVRWTERRVKASWRWLRTSNLYRLLMPERPVERGMMPPALRRSTTGQFVKGGESLFKKEGGPSNFTDAEARIDALRQYDIVMGAALDRAAGKIA